MRERVDAFGVSEPEIARTGKDQIEVNLPGVDDAERAAEQVGSTAQLFFYDWEANILDENCKTNPTTEINGGQQPVTGLYNAVKRAVQVRHRRCRRTRQAAANAALLRVRQGHQEAVRQRHPGRVARRGARRADRGAEGARPRSSRSSPACSSLRGEKPARQCARPRLVLGHPRRPGPLAARTSRTRSRTSTAARRQRAERHLRLHRQGPQGVPERSRARSPSAAPTTPTRATRPESSLPALRDRARQRAHLGAVHQLPREPGRHRRRDRRADLRRLHDHQRAGPREAPQDRRPADRARADLALAGLRHARQAGARPGPDRGHRRLRRSSRCSCSSSTASWASSRSVALCVYAIYFYALIKLIPITLTLPGIAGLILTIGVAADANIVIFERVKEEVRAGRSMAAGIAAGYKKGLDGDHRRQRRHVHGRVHPLHPRHGGGQGLRVHARHRHARLAVHRGARDPGDPRLAAPLAAARHPSALGAGRRSKHKLHASTSWARRSGSSRRPA